MPRVGFCIIYAVKQQRPFTKLLRNIGEIITTINVPV
jgi:hypothetical protein